MKPTLNVHSLLQKLKPVLPDSGIVIMNSEAKLTPSFKLPKPKVTILDNDDLRSRDNVQQFIAYKEKLVLEKDEAADIERLTRGQHTNAIWHDVRCGRLTSSNFGAIQIRKCTTEPDNLVKRIMGYVSMPDKVETRWGREHEPAARRKYFITMGKTHPHITVGQCGLIIDKDRPYLAASPDGLVDCPDCKPQQGVLEIKCPHKWRNNTVEEATSNPDFCCIKDKGTVQIKKSHAYYYQVQGQMGITGRKWCDFVVWTLKDMFIQRIEFDPLLWEEMKTKLEKFFVEGVVPEIFTNRIERGIPLYTHVH